MTDIKKRFEDKVIHLVWTDCVTIEGTPNNGGYLSFSMGARGTQVGAHVAAWLLDGREIPVGYDLDHLCRHRWCVNVAHLEPVTRKVNLARGKQSSRPDESKCRKGLHDWTDDNTFVDSHGKTRCLSCYTEYHINYRAMLSKEL